MAGRIAQGGNDDIGQELAAILANAYADLFVATIDRGDAKRLVGPSTSDVFRKKEAGELRPITCSAV
jgi:hypothetical protein